jgi:hypothetical protein
MAGRADGRYAHMLVCTATYRYVGGTFCLDAYIHSNADVYCSMSRHVHSSHFNFDLTYLAFRGITNVVLHIILGALRLIVFLQHTAAVR